MSLQAIYIIPKSERKGTKPFVEIPSEYANLPVYKDKSAWISGLRLNKINAFPVIENKSAFPLDIKSGPKGFYKVTKGYLPLFEPFCEVEFLYSGEELSRLYKQELHEIFILPIKSTVNVKNIHKLHDYSVKRVAAFTLNMIDVHCVLTKAQVEEIFEENLTPNPKYFISSLNNYHSQEYYSENYFNLFDEVKDNLEAISDKIAISYQNKSKRYYRINEKLANEILQIRKVTRKLDKKNLYEIPYKEFSMLKDKHDAYLHPYCLADLLEVLEISPELLFSKGKQILIKKHSPSILFEKKIIHDMLKVKITNNYRISENHLDYNLFKHLTIHPTIKIERNLSICNIYNTRYNKFFIETKSFNQLVQRECDKSINLDDAIKIPNHRLSHFILSNKQNPDIILVGADNDYFYFNLEGDASELALKFIIEYYK